MDSKKGRCAGSSDKGNVDGAWWMEYGHPHRSSVRLKKDGAASLLLEVLSVWNFAKSNISRGKLAQLRQFLWK